MTESISYKNKRFRADRVKILRQMTGLSHVEFDTQFDIPIGSSENWESAHYGGLTDMAAQKIVESAPKLGLSCSYTWLMDGLGVGPLYSTSSDSALKQRHNRSNPAEQVQLIYQELLIIRKFYNNDVIHSVVENDGMLPFLKVGDYVAGPRYYASQVGQLVGENCLVELEDKRILIRQIKEMQAQRYTLVCLNPYTSLPLPALYDTKVISAAPILWVRRLDCVV
ncbi:MAG: hypothetical protein COB66_08135 [Coxiella sp. (in: Bacteria)]|nr:MAG: hypothetical protein COB66_08135 [Coxiella sp. (in: g-proteobacteria)]